MKGDNAGLVTMRCDFIALQQHWAFILKYEASFPKQKANHILSLKRLNFH